MRVGAVVKRRVQLDGGRARPVPRAFAGLNEVMAAEQHDARVARRAVGQPAPRRRIAQLGVVRHGVVLEEKDRLVAARQRGVRAAHERLGHPDASERVERRSALLEDGRVRVASARDVPRMEEPAEARAARIVLISVAERHDDEGRRLGRRR